MVAFVLSTFNTYAKLGFHLPTLHLLGCKYVPPTLISLHAPFVQFWTFCKTPPWFSWFSLRFTQNKSTLLYKLIDNSCFNSTAIVLFCQLIAQWPWWWHCEQVNQWRFYFYIQTKPPLVDMLTIISVISLLKSCSMYLQNDGRYSEMGTLSSTGFNHDTEASGRQLWVRGKAGTRK